MKGKEFINRAAKWARANGLAWRVEVDEGKGGHKIIYIGQRRTVVQTGEIPKGTFHVMLKQLGISKEEF